MRGPRGIRIDDRRGGSSWKIGPSSGHDFELGMCCHIATWTLQHFRNLLPIATSVALPVGVPSKTQEVVEECMGASTSCPQLPLVPQLPLLVLSNLDSNHKDLTATTATTTATTTTTTTTATPTNEPSSPVPMPHYSIGSESPRIRHRVVSTHRPSRRDAPPPTAHYHHHQQQQHQQLLRRPSIDNDADTAAGASQHPQGTTPSKSGHDRTMLSTCPSSGNGEFFEDLVSDPVLVLGVDISHLNRKSQFIVCAAGVFFFSLLYGFLQELISVKLCNRKLGLFLAAVQFAGYSMWAFVFQLYVYRKHHKPPANATTSFRTSKKIAVPLLMYLGLSLLRALDLGMTNLAMQYINYPAKTLMKSSRVVFTMFFGVIMLKKRYRSIDYMVVLLMVTGLCIFMHADANSSAVFHHVGIGMLTISLLCDGAISNMSERIMNEFGVGQDEFIFNMYSIAFCAITLAAALKGDLWLGLKFLTESGTYGEIDLPPEQRSLYWSSHMKIGVVVLFSTMGFFGSSCSAAITKNFGALTMSLTSTARKATTLFISFAIFENECTVGHVMGIMLFLAALLLKSIVKFWNTTTTTPTNSSTIHTHPTNCELELMVDTNTDTRVSLRTSKSLPSHHGNNHALAHIV